MRAVQELMAEHEAVLTALRILDRITHGLAEKRGSAADDLSSLLEFFEVFVDRCHHGKEETVLFPEMVERGVRREGGPVGVMLAEHEIGREQIRGMKAALERLRIGELEAVDAIRRHARGYQEMLQAHIFKENNILFPMAARIIPEEVAEQLVTKFDALEHDQIGEGKHEAYHAMLDALAERYDIS